MKRRKNTKRRCELEYEESGGYSIRVKKKGGGGIPSETAFVGTFVGPIPPPRGVDLPLSPSQSFSFS